MNGDALLAGWIRELLDEARRRYRFPGAAVGLLRDGWAHVPAPLPIDTSASPRSPRGWFEPTGGA